MAAVSGQRYLTPDQVNSAKNYFRFGPPDGSNIFDDAHDSMDQKKKDLAEAKANLATMRGYLDTMELASRQGLVTASDIHDAESDYVLFGKALNDAAKTLDLEMHGKVSDEQLEFARDILGDLDDVFQYSPPLAWHSLNNNPKIAVDLLKRASDAGQIPKSEYFAAQAKFDAARKTIIADNRAQEEEAAVPKAFPLTRGIFGSDDDDGAMIGVLAIPYAVVTIPLDLIHLVTVFPVKYAMHALNPKHFTGMEGLD